MAIATWSTSTAASATCSIPAGMIDGDVLVAAARGSAGASPAAPTGWIKIADVSSGGVWLAGYLRVVMHAASEPANVTFAGAGLIGMQIYRGVDPAAPINSTTASTATGTTAVALPSLFRERPRGALVSAASFNSGGMVPPPGMTMTWSLSTLIAARQLNGSPVQTSGDSGGRTWTSGSGSPTVALGWMISLRPLPVIEVDTSVYHTSLNQFPIYKRGWRSPVMVEGSGVQASWGVSDPGRFSVIVPARNQLLGGADWLGRWIWWVHPTMGVWSGYVEDAPINNDGGTVEISGVGHADILNYRWTRRRYSPVSGPGGAIVNRAITDIKLDAGMPVMFSASEAGDFVSFQFRGNSAGDVMSSVQSSTGHEWRSFMDGERTLNIEWRERVGRDETSRVVFTEGVNLISLQVDQTISNTINDILAIADDNQYLRARGARVDSPGSVAQFGRRQETIQYKGMVAQSTLGPRAQRDLQKLAVPAVNVTLQVHHLDPQLVYVREGTQIRVVSAAANAVYRARVMTRDVDLDAGVVTLSCEAIQDITRATEFRDLTWSNLPTS